MRGLSKISESAWDKKLKTREMHSAGGYIPVQKYLDKVRRYIILINDSCQLFCFQRLGREPAERQKRLKHKHTHKSGEAGELEQ